MTTHTNPDGRELRRPTTAGPWHPYKRNAGVVLAACPEAENASGLVQVAASAPGDGPAIADLPDWIARADMLARRLAVAEACIERAARESERRADRSAGLCDPLLVATYRVEAGAFLRSLEIVRGPA